MTSTFRTSPFRPLLILGMHRSGTSCLAGCLQEAGLYLGDVNTEAGFNKKGNREDHKIMELHDRILKRTKASWDKPPKQEPKWTAQEKKDLTSLLATFPSNTVWGIKDPRALLLLTGWHEVSTPTCIGTFRHPAEVIASLVHRAREWKQPMSKAKAANLWDAYNQRMLKQYAKQPFDIIRYDIDVGLYYEKLDAVIKPLGLSIPKSPKFRDAKLHNQHSIEQKIPAKLRVTWEALNAIAR
jgi:hypothetical protein